MISQALKRAFDFVAALAGLVVISPLFLLVAAVIKLTSPGPVFFRGERVGQFGRPFRMWKFRTMVRDAAAIGPGITGAADPRVTSIGRWLRKTKLDELPQLLSVLAGEMSLVGPRPEDPRYVALYTKEQRKILDLKPGITSRASVTFRSEEELLSGPNWEQVYRDEIMPRKIAADLEYARTANLLRDVVLILETLITVARPKAAHPPSRAGAAGRSLAPATRKATTDPAPSPQRPRGRTAR